MKARNTNDSSPALRRSPGLCGRFGQPAPPRTPQEGRSRAPGRAPQVGRRPRRAPRSAGRTRGSIRRERGSVRRGRVLAARPAAPGPRGRSWSSRTAAPIPPRNISGDPARRAQYWCGLGPCCTFDWNPLSENPRNHAETPRRSTLLKCSHVQSGSLCTWESITVTSPIHENRGIARKTRNQAAGAPLSNVQHPQAAREVSAPPGNSGRRIERLCLRHGPAANHGMERAPRDQVDGPVEDLRQRLDEVLDLPAERAPALQRVQQVHITVRTLLPRATDPKVECGGVTGVGDAAPPRATDPKTSRRAMP